jgi:hypothetical protein
MCVVLYQCITMAIEMASKVGIFSSLFICPSPWQLPGGYKANTCPMVISRGFWCHPRLTALGIIGYWLVLTTIVAGKQAQVKYPLLSYTNEARSDFGNSGSPSSVNDAMMSLLRL